MGCVFDTSYNIIEKEDIPLMIFILMVNGALQSTIMEIILLTIIEKDISSIQIEEAKESKGEYGIQ